MKKVAIIGSGISGLTCAWKLANDHEVTVFEQNDYLGGHTHTVAVNVGSGRYEIDTGFIVCNNRTYPNFLQLLNEWNVEVQKTTMSFSVACELNGLEYNGTTLNSLFAQRKNILSPYFWRLLFGILRFNKAAKQWLNNNDTKASATLGDFLRETGIAGPAVSHYLIPMTAAIWSTALTEVEKFPLHFFLHFCDNHGLFNINDRPQWYVIKGGSHQYVHAMRSRCRATFDIKQAVTSVARGDNNVTLTMASGEQRVFDYVVFACHSDEALSLLENASDDERAILSAIKYQQNEVILHTDTSLLPRERRAWAAWNYLLPKNDSGLPTVTYNMNMLQGLSSPETFCVTLNRSGDIAPASILGRYLYSHPQFTPSAIAAQHGHHLISGVSRTFYCGAYWRYGFHEDGVQSALRVVEQIRSC